MLCEKCGHTNNRGLSFCSKCGAPLKSENKTQPIDVESINISKGPQLRFKPKDKVPKPSPIIAIILVLVIVVGTVAALSIRSLDAKKYKEQIDIGSIYLEELKYEQAVETFTKAIDIKPKWEAAYAGVAKSYIGLEQAEKAKGILEKGLAKVKKPGKEFMDLCDTLGVKVEGAGIEVTTALTTQPTTGVVQTTDEFIGRSISTAYTVKTKAGSSLNIRSGPGLNFDPVTKVFRRDRCNRSIPQ